MHYPTVGRQELCEGLMQMWLRRILVAELMITICFAPLPLGSNRDWSWSPLVIVVGTMLLLQSIDAAVHRFADSGLFIWRVLITTGTPVHR